MTNATLEVVALRILAAVCALATLALASPVRAAVTGNLIVNPDAETGNTSGWVDALAHGFGVSPGAFAFPVQSGAHSFWAGVTGPASAAWTNEIRQDINVSAYSSAIDAGTAVAYFSGYGRTNSASGSTDNGRIIVEYRNGVGSVLQSFDTGNITPVNTWVLEQNSRTAPVGTRTIRVRLLGNRGGGASTDCGFDALSFTLDGVTAASRSSWGRVKGRYRR